MSIEEPESREAAAPATQQEVRRITDAQTMRALAHPVRVAIIEQLGVGGPMTATGVGERIGESPTTCSFHLRQLAKYGFVEEAGGGQGRARPWRLKNLAMRLADVQDNPEAQIAANAVVQMFHERATGRYQTWQQTKSTYPREWQKASFEAQQISYLTAEELEQVGEELSALLWDRYRDRMTNPSTRPPGAVPVEVLMFGYPMSPSAGSDTDGTGAGS